MKFKTTAALFLILLLANGAHLLFREIQPRIQYNAGLGFDGVSYYKMYLAFKSGELPLQRLTPYNNRVLVPFLATLIPVENPIRAFQIINFVFLNLFVLLMSFIWWRLRIPYYLMVLGFAWFFLHWIGPNRYYVYYPVLVDVPTFFFQALLLLLVVRDDYRWLPAVAPIAVLQKESFLILVVLLLFCKIAEAAMARPKGDEKRKFNASFFFLGGSIVLMLAAKFLSNRFLIQGVGPSEIEILLNWVRIRLSDPYGWLRWIAAIFIGYGAFPLLFLHNLKNVKANRLNFVLAVFAASSCALGFLAGSDITRIVALGFPSVMTLILISIADYKKSHVLIATVLALPVLRLLNFIAEPAIDAAENATEGFYSWLAEYAHLSIVNYWVLYAVILYLIVGGMKAYEARRAR